MLLGAALCGCHNRAYDELYIENMAAEIRDLEDQLYEYDHEYRALEQELASLRAENDRRAAASPRPAPQIKAQPTPIVEPEFLPRGDAESVAPGPAAEEAIAPLETRPDSILQGEARSEPSAFPPSDSSPAGEDTLPPPRLPADPRKAPPADNDFDLDSLLPPTIEPGEPMPPPRSAPGETTGNARLAPADDLEMNLSRIEIPAQLAGKSTGGPAKLTLVAEKVTDTRVVELAFHSTLSRSANFDEDSHDDGLVLVLQPRNERGQMVPAIAALSIVVLDPAREGSAARIGRWDYSPEEVKRKMQPIGSGQGIQLTLPWNGPDPLADRVIVFGRYTFDNGRQVIGQKEIFVTSEGAMKTVWSPRGNASDVGASLAAAAEPNDARSGAPLHVVRPASGTAPLEPAPAPSSARQ